MKNNGYTHVVVDVLYDFIDGSLACQYTEEAIGESIKYINSHPDQNVLYVCDCHPQSHCSFKINGGLWPVHCVPGTRGAEIHEKYYNLIDNVENRPGVKNMFLKGENPNEEQYSGFDGINKAGEKLSVHLSKNVIVSGIAAEYCIKETCLDLHKAGYKVYLIEKAMAHIEPEGRAKALKEMKEKGIEII